MSGSSYQCQHGMLPSACAICSGPQSVMSEETIQTCLTDGSPVPDDGSHKELKDNGQQKGYVVLSQEERAKGFVRPYRTTYVHVGRRPKAPLRDLTPEEQERYAERGYVKFEPELDENSPVTGRFWTQADLDAGCGSATTMGRALAETYARDPSFYGATFCVGCGTHFPLEQFVWDNTDVTVGE